MHNYVRPQIYSATPIKVVEAQLRAGEMPTAFTRRMRVINLLSAVTLRKMESEMLAPFDVMDLHHILDKQISQDTIINALESESLAQALKTGDLKALWAESGSKPLLLKGLEQGWIQRFNNEPFDPICVMLSYRAKLMLEVVDELGHSYNLLRKIGMGWIEFGEVPGEEAGDPESYVPGGISTPADYPTGTMDPSTISDDAYGALTTPATLEYSPGAPMSGGHKAGQDGGGALNCCLDLDDPLSNVSLGYETAAMALNQTQVLTVEKAHPSCAGKYYAWAITDGPGELSAVNGLEVIYTAPASGQDCPGNATITLSCGGELMDSLIVTINYDYVITWNDSASAETIARGASESIYVIANNTPLTWEVSGTGFTLTHAETNGAGNTLHADGSACGMAVITVTGCDGQTAEGRIKCDTGVWHSYASMEIPRCPGGGNCFDDGGVYIGSGSWIKGEFKMVHASLWGNRETGVIQPSVDGSLGPVYVEDMVQSIGPYMATGDIGIDNVAYFYHWAC